MLFQQCLCFAKNNYPAKISNGIFFLKKKYIKEWPLLALASIFL